MSTKIHATVDALGNPTGFYLTPGQASDLENTDTLLHDAPAELVIADKAYNAQTLVVAPLIQAGKTVVIPCLRTSAVLMQAWADFLSSSADVCE